MSTSQASAASPLIRVPAGRHVEGSHRAMFFRPASSLDTQFAAPAPPARPSLQREHSGVPPQTPAMAAQFISQNNPGRYPRYLSAAQREASFERLLEGAGLKRGDPIPAPVEGVACYRNLAGGETRCRVTRGGLSEREARHDAGRRQRERRRAALEAIIWAPTPAVEDPVSRRGALAAASAAGVAPPPPPALRRAYTGGRKSRKRRKRRKTRGRRKRCRRSRRRKKRKRRRTRRRRRH